MAGLNSRPDRRAPARHRGGTDRAGGAIGTPCKRKKHCRLGKYKKLFNRRHATVRAPGERGAAILKGWHILRRARCSSSRLTAVVQAVLALHHPAG
ncbi:hypothetical protein GCM10010191_47100 [Actinomadura vinacea]|uniref:DDE Tnp4 domain-containing protein n=1 Tax=Actinomadura vinacea TaxID=115336 RepID=A0ABN3JEX1_9ACTN